MGRSTLHPISGAPCRVRPGCGLSRHGRDSQGPVWHSPDQDGPLAPYSSVQRLERRARGPGSARWAVLKAVSVDEQLPERTPAQADGRQHPDLRARVQDLAPLIAPARERVSGIA